MLPVLHIHLHPISMAHAAANYLAKCRQGTQRSMPGLREKQKSNAVPKLWFKGIQEEKTVS